MGRCGAMGLRALPLWSLGVGARAMGLVPRRVRRASAVGTGAGRLGRRGRVGCVRDVWLTGLRLGPIGLGRAISSLVEPLLPQLLGELQPAVRRQRRRPAEQPAFALPQCGLSRCVDGGFRCDDCQADAGRIESRGGAHAPDGDSARARGGTGGGFHTLAHSRSEDRRRRGSAAARIDVLSGIARGATHCRTDDPAGRSTVGCPRRTSHQPPCRRHTGACDSTGRPWLCEASTECPWLCEAGASCHGPGCSRRACSTRTGGQRIAPAAPITAAASARNPGGANSAVPGTVGADLFRTDCTAGTRESACFRTDRRNAADASCGAIGTDL